MKEILLFTVICAISICAFSQSEFNGLDTDMGNLYRMSNAQTRSISPENYTGEKGKGGMAKIEDKDIKNKANASYAARDLGQGWKVNPYMHIQPGETLPLGEINGSGAIQHIWMAFTSGNLRFAILRFYWDDETEPSVECPVSDFFATGWNEIPLFTSLAICVNPGYGLNCYWTMPFRNKCRVTMENMNEVAPVTIYYQIDYILTKILEDAAYFHAQFRRTNPDTTSDYTIVDNIKGKGQYVGTYLAWGVKNNGWWGEGEIKFFIDGDGKFPTICGTGTEDYFCGSHNFDRNGQYTTFCSPYSGLNQVIRPDGAYKSQQCFGMYRWHIKDPIRFEKDLKVTIQDLGWRQGGRYLQQHSDISSVCFWYQAEPHAKFPTLPSWQELEVN